MGEIGSHEERKEGMKRRRGIDLLGLLAVLVMALLLSGCGANGAGKEDAETITVYMWSTTLYDGYAPYIQAQLPDVNIEFVVGNNDLDFYKFLNENGALPDIITCRRFSLHDAAGLKEQLMDLSTTDAAGAVYDAYITSFTNADGTINWLPLCAEVDGLVANRGLFEQYGIPLPTDYASFVAACDAFEAVGIRGFTADFAYDYTCMEVLQGLSIPEITSLQGRQWRSGYENPEDMTVVGLDDAIWPEAFARMERFIRDTRLGPEDVELNYTPVINMFTEGRVAMIRACGSNTVWFNKQGTDAVFLPYFGQDGGQWLLTYPQFQVALNRDLAKDKARRDTALRVLNVMLSEGVQNALANGEDVLTYSRNVDLHVSPVLDNLKPLIDQNHLYIRIASNDFFAVSQDVVTRMLQGELNAQQAYEAFDAQLRQPKAASGETVLSQEKGYSSIFHRKGGNESYSVLANTLRGCYGSDVLIAPGYSFTGSVLKADYTEKMVGYMVMPNALIAWHREMTSAELKTLLKAFVEGVEGGFVPFNRGSLPAVSGISIEVKEDKGAYRLTQVRRNGKPLADGETLQVTCLNTAAYMAPIIADDGGAYEQDTLRVRNALTQYIRDGGALAEPTPYMTLK